ncbi:hypothetical protein ACKAV7_005377 [Fusarium commune]
MRYSYTILAFAITALALPTAKPADDGKGALGINKGENTRYDGEKWSAGKQNPGDKSKRDDIKPRFDCGGGRADMGGAHVKGGAQYWQTC